MAQCFIGHRTPVPPPSSGQRLRSPRPWLAPRPRHSHGAAWRQHGHQQREESAQMCIRDRAGVLASGISSPAASELSESFPGLTIRTRSPSERYACPTVTSCWPSESPERTSVTPFPVRPVVISTYRAASPSTTNTYWVSAVSYTHLIPLFQRPGANLGHGAGGDQNLAGSNGSPVGRGLLRHVHHAGAALVVEMREHNYPPI